MQRSQTQDQLKLKTLSQSVSQEVIQAKNLRSQLSYMLKENDTLRKDVKGLNRSLQQS